MGKVYIFGDSEQENMFKIGVTRGSIENRIKKLQTGNSSKLYLVDYFESKHPFLLEKNLHDHFRNQKVLNEWFNLTAEDLISFKDTCNKIENRLKSLETNFFYAKKYGNTSYYDESLLF